MGLIVLAATTCFVVLQLCSQLSNNPTSMFKKLKGRTASWNTVRSYAIDHSVLILGNAPSIMQLPLHLLSGEPQVLVMSRFPLIAARYPWKPNFYICIDSVVCQDNADEINQYLAENRDIIGFFPANFGPYYYDYIRAGPNILRFHF